MLWLTIFNFDTTVRNDRFEIDRILHQGSRKARPRAAPTFEKVRKKIGPMGMVEKIQLKRKFHDRQK